MCTLVKFRRMLLRMFDFDCSKIDQFSHQILKLLNVSPRSRTEVECLMNVRFHCLRSEYRHRPCEVVHRKVQTALCPLLCMAGFRFSLFLVCCLARTSRDFITKIITDPGRMALRMKMRGRTRRGECHAKMGCLAKMAPPRQNSP